MNTIGRLFRVAALTGLAALLFPAAVWAQSLSISSAEAGPGAEVVLDVTLSDSTDIAAANLTVTLPNTDVANFLKFDGTHVVELATATSAWEIDENLVSATELRVVLYSNAIPPAALNAGTDVAVARVHFQVNAGASATDTVEVSLDAGVDASVTPNVGLTRLSDPDGVSITPGVFPGLITVIPSFTPIDIDFADGAGAWQLFQIFPTPANPSDPEIRADQPGIGIGLQVLQISDTAKTFGFYTSPLSVIPPAESADILLRTTWEVRSSAADPANAPGFRLRLNGSDFTVAETVEIQSPTGIVGSRLSPGTSTKAYQHFVVQTDSIRNGLGVRPTPEDNDGYIANFDLMGFAVDASGAVGESIVLEHLGVDGTALPSGAGTPVAAFNYDFSAAGTGTLGWNPVNLDYVSPTGITADQYPNTAQTGVDNGLILQATGTQLDQGRFGYAAWFSPLTTITADANLLYRLNITVASTTGDAARTPHFRVLVLSQDFQWGRQFEVVSKVGDASLAPSASGTTYPVYFVYPPEMAGADILVQIDMVNDQPADDPNGSLKVVGASLESLTVPTF